MNGEFSYLYGLLQADGNLYEQTRNRGKVTLEISKRDEDIILLLDGIIKHNTYISRRKRTTNFGKIETVCLSICDKKFRDRIKELGFPVGKKSEIIKPPTEEFSEVDYIRGLIDGDGSLGLTGNGFPFLSLVASSDYIKEYYIDFIYRITGKRKNINRNKRDNVYNISVYKEDAQKIVDALYYNGCICLNRKLEKSKDVLSWVRPDNMEKRPWKY